MRVDALLAACRALPYADLASLTCGKRIIVLSPHPDDESLGTGGLIAAAWEAGVAVDVVMLTDGAASHPNSRTHPPSAMAALRREEAADALAALGVPAGRLTHLDLPDGAAPHEGPVFEATVERLVALVRQSDAGALFVTWHLDPHWDHEAAAAMAGAVRHRVPDLAVWAYPIWAWHRDPAEEIDAIADGVRLDIRPWLARKHAAIAAHVSQMAPMVDDDPEGFRFTPETLAPFLASDEIFLRVP